VNEAEESEQGFSSQRTNCPTRCSRYLLQCALQDGGTAESGELLIPAPQNMQNAMFHASKGLTFLTTDHPTTSIDEGSGAIAFLFSDMSVMLPTH